MGYSYGFKLFGGGGTGGGVGTSTNTQVLYNSSGIVAGDAGLTYDAATDTLTSGRVIVGDGSVAAPSYSFSSATGAGWSYANTQPTLSIVGVDVAAMDTSVTWKLRGDGRFGWTATGSTASAADTVITRGAPATLQIGAAPNATPVANTLIVGESGSGTDIAGANGVISSGIGTGSGAGSTLTFKTPTAHGSDGVAQTQTTRMVLSQYGGTVDGFPLFGPASSDQIDLGFHSNTWRNVYLTRATLGSKSKALTDASVTAFATIPMADGVATGGKLIYRYVVTSGTSRQVVSGSINYAAARDGATYAVDYDEIQQSTAVTTGTLTGSVTAAGASDLLTFTATFDSSLNVAGTLYYRFDSTDTLAITPL